MGASHEMQSCTRSVIGVRRDACWDMHGGRVMMLGGGDGVVMASRAWNASALGVPVWRWASVEVVIGSREYR